MQAQTHLQRQPPSVGILINTPNCVKVPYSLEPHNLLLGRERNILKILIQAIKCSTRNQNMSPSLPSPGWLLIQNPLSHREQQVLSYPCPTWAQGSPESSHKSPSKRRAPEPVLASSSPCQIFWTGSFWEPIPNESFTHEGLSQSSALAQLESMSHSQRHQVLNCLLIPAP